MPRWGKPSSDDVACFLHKQATCPLTYTAVGATLSAPPAGYNVDHTRVRLGQGETVFRAAQSALRRLDQFRLGWLEASMGGESIQIDVPIAVLARSFGLWWLNACRIVAIIDDDGPIRRWGYAYGTLPAHIGSGEERFLLEWDRAEGSVWYDILAFSRPHQLLARLGAPLMRRIQKSFGPASAAALRRAAQSEQ